MMSTYREPVFFQGNGQPLNKASFMQNLEIAIRNKPKNVILLGENHSDPSSHTLELEVLQKAAELKPGKTSIKGIKVEINWFSNLSRCL